MNIKKLLLAVGLLFSSQVMADSVADVIKAALADYNGKNYSATVENLSMALQLANQEKSHKLADFFPDKIYQWEAEDIEYNYEQSLLYGGVNIARYYHKNNGTIKVSLIADLPYSQKMVGMLSNPLLIRNEGSKMEVINGNKAALKFDDYHKNGSLNISVDNRYLVSVEGYSVNRKTIVEFAEALGMQSLKDFQ